MGIQIHNATTERLTCDDIVNITITDVESTFEGIHTRSFYRKITISHLKNKEGEISKSEIILHAERAADLAILSIKEKTI